ncbi:MAG: hypothetical protein GY750_18800 [Lentisphaerae bacterium]|nr:hypothetical protein [Lentisphaerota bacterium]
MIAVKLETLMKRELDGIGRAMAERFCEFAEAKIKIGQKTTRYSMTKLQEAADYVSNHPEAIIRYDNITEARSNLTKSNSQFCSTSTLI